MTPLPVTSKSTTNCENPTVLSVRPKIAELVFQLYGRSLHPELFDIYQSRTIKRAGYEDVAVEVQRLWLDGKREEAAAKVPDAMVLKTNLLGTDSMVKDRIRAYRDAGVTTLRVDPAGGSLEERLETLGRVLDLVNDVSAEGQQAAS